MISFVWTQARIVTMSPTLLEKEEIVEVAAEEEDQAEAETETEEKEAGRDSKSKAVSVAGTALADPALSFASVLLPRDHEVAQPARPTPELAAAARRVVGPSPFTRVPLPWQTKSLCKIVTGNVRAWIACV